MFGGLFGRPQRRTAADATAQLRAALESGRSLAEEKLDEKEAKRISDEISQTMTVVKDMLFPESAASAGANAGAAEESNEPDPEDHISALVDISRKSDFLLILAEGLAVMEFETRKDAVQVFNNLLRRSLMDESSTIELISRDGEMLISRLVVGYDDSETALNYGAMLRECLRNETLAKVAVNHVSFWRFFDLIEVPDFDVASDAFASFKELLTKHVHIGAEFIEEHYDRFITSYNKLLRSSNYMTRRQSLKLLGLLLVERKFFKIMTRYIASPTNLRLVMNLLLDQRKNIQYEAFHVFKIFVANPNKTEEVRQILLRNRDRLLAYLADFQAEREDVPFQEDRALILEEIRKLAA